MQTFCLSEANVQCMSETQRTKKTFVYIICKKGLHLLTFSSTHHRKIYYFTRQDTICEQNIGKSVIVPTITKSIDTHWFAFYHVTQLTNITFCFSWRAADYIEKLWYMRATWNVLIFIGNLFAVSSHDLLLIFYTFFKAFYITCSPKIGSPF